MIAVIGSFRFPSERVEEARPHMREVIAETLKEEGCLAYSYAQDATESGLFRVLEMWTSREALERHFQTPHMIAWADERVALGFYERNICVHPIGVGVEL